MPDQGWKQSERRSRSGVPDKSRELLSWPIRLPDKLSSGQLHKIRYQIIFKISVLMLVVGCMFGTIAKGNSFKLLRHLMINTGGLEVT